jgi:hypothetical protein
MGVMIMPWDQINHWACSTFDPSNTSGWYQFDTGVIFALAMVASTPGPVTTIFSTTDATLGAGSATPLMVVTDSSGNHLANGTGLLNFFTNLTYPGVGIPGPGPITLDATLTLTVSSIYYVCFLFPSPQNGFGANLLGTSYSMAKHLGKPGNRFVCSGTGQSSIPSPVPISGYSDAPSTMSQYNAMPWFALGA